MSDIFPISNLRQILRLIVERAHLSYHQHAPSGKGLTRNTALHKGMLTENCGFGVMAWDAPTQGEFSTYGPSWIGATLPLALKQVRETFQHMTVGPGDIFIMNDPYQYGVHPREIMLFSPLFCGSKPLLWIGASLLWPDFGGMTRAGFSTRQSETEQQGIRISPLLLMDKGKLNRPILELISSNIRDPKQRRQDLRCAINSFQNAQHLIQDLIPEAQGDIFQQTWDKLRDRKKAFFISILEQGDFKTEGQGEALLDSDGFVDQQIRLSVQASLYKEKQKPSLHVTFPEIPPITLGPRNFPFSVTLSACADALAQLFPDLDTNICFTHLLDYINIPQNSYYDAPYPAPVCAQDWSGYFALRSAATIAFAAILPADNQYIASQAESATSIGEIGLFGQNSDASPFALHGYFPGGTGACHLHDGQSALFPNGFTPKPLCPEQMERQAPITVTDYTSRTDSTGLGEYCGGSGLKIRFRLNEGAGYVTARSDQGQWGPAGVNQGLDGAPTEIYIEDEEGEVRHQPWLASREDAMMLQSGDSFSILTPGGGGYGSLNNRPRDIIQNDLAAGIISQQYLDDYKDELEDS